MSGEQMLIKINKAPRHSRKNSSQLCNVCEFQAIPMKSGKSKSKAYRSRTVLVTNRSQLDFIQNDVIVYKGMYVYVCLCMFMYVYVCLCLCLCLSLQFP